MKTNPVAWFEIYVDDMARATAFYETVLKTSLDKLEDPTESDSGMKMMSFPMDMESGGAPGALVKMEGFQTGANSTVVYFACDDCAVEESRVVNAGGKIEKPKKSIGEFGFISLVVDTEGNMIGLHSMS